jgi:outer membrane protein insertion porin family
LAIPRPLIVALTAFSWLALPLGLHAQDPDEPVPAQRPPALEDDNDDDGGGEDEAADGAEGAGVASPSGDQALPRAPARLPDYVLAAVEVVGNRRTEAEAIRQNIRLETGGRFDQRVVREDVRRLWGMGLFQDIRVTKVNGPRGGMVVTFHVTEKPTIHDVIIDGNDDVSTDDIKGAIDVKPLQMVDEGRLRDNARKIERLYTDKGFYLVEVRHDLRAPKRRKGEVVAVGEGSLTRGEEVDVVFTIVENAKVVIERIGFTGNTAIPDDEIKQFMQSKEHHPLLGKVTGWGTYKEEDFQVDLLRVEALFQDRGYLNVRVGQPRVRLTADKRAIHVTIPVEEGDQYHLRGLAVDGDLMDPDSVEAYGEWVDRWWQKARRVVRQDRRQVERKLMDLVEIRPGDVFSRTQVARDIQAIVDLYKDAGYAYVNVTPETQVDPVGRYVDMTLRVEKGPPCTIERVEIVGNEKTRDKVIRRELRVYEGELFSQSGMRESQARLQALGFFETVEVTQRQGSAPDLVEVQVDVKEKSTGTFQLGAGFSSAENFLFQGQVAQNNFLGRGQTLALSASVSALRRFFDFNFVEPYFLGTDATGSVSLFNQQRIQPGFTRTGTGGDFSLGYPVYRDLRLYGGYEVERSQIDEGSFAVTLKGLASQAPRYTTALRGTVAYDTRNNRLFPTKGFFHTLSVEGASRFLGSGLAPVAETWASRFMDRYRLPEQLNILKKNGEANDFIRTGLGLRGYYPIGFGFVLRGNFRLGYIFVPGRPLFTENYFAGGFGSVRGYSPRSIGPVARVGGLNPDDELTDFVIGGNKELVVNLELEIPIFEKLGIKGVVFVDAGNAYAPDENLFYLLTDPNPALKGTPWDPRVKLKWWGGLYWAVGAGFRWQSPIGPLRFEWGIPLTRRPKGTVGYPSGDQPVLFEFNIGQSF